MQDDHSTPLDGVAGSRVSRRTLIKTGAAVAGAAWVAPAVDSFLSPAAASSHPTFTGNLDSGFCSYTLIVYHLPGTTTQLAVKINGTGTSGSCANDNTDGSFKGVTLGTCSGKTYAISGNVITANGSTIPAGKCTDGSFTVSNAGLITWTGVIVDFAFVHDGSFQHCGQTGTILDANGKQYTGLPLCSPTSVSVASGCCTNS
jgi:hypothetical protein